MVSIGIVPKVRFLWDCLWPGTSANFFFNFQEFLWNDWFFFLFFLVHRYVHPWWMVVICFFSLWFNFHSTIFIFFQKVNICQLSIWNHQCLMWCAGAQSLCHLLTWSSYLKHMLVPEGEQSRFVVVPLLKQADGKRTVRKSLEATRMGPLPFCHDVWEGNPNNESAWQRRSWRVRETVVLLRGKCLWLYSLCRKRRLNILDVQPCYTIAGIEMGDL